MTGLYIAPLRILSSFYYFARQDLHTLVDTYLDGYRPDWFADSGAYSAYTQNETVSITEYINWVKTYRDLFTVYANLDVIGDPLATYENNQRMLDAGLNPLPVFHVGEDWSYLERYLDDGHDYIGIGGAVSHMSSSTNLMRWFIRVFKIVGGRARLHGFGVTGLEYLRGLDWYSTDSTAWVAGSIYGTMRLFDRRTGQLYKPQLAVAKDWVNHRGLIKHYGYKVAHFALKKHHQNERNTALGGLVYREIEGYIRDRQNAVDPPNQSGYRLYLSNSRMTNFKYVYRAMRAKGLL